MDSKPEKLIILWRSLNFYKIVKGPDTPRSSKHLVKFMDSPIIISGDFNNCHQPRLYKTTITQIVIGRSQRKIRQYMSDF